MEIMGITVEPTKFVIFIIAAVVFLVGGIALAAVLFGSKNRQNAAPQDSFGAYGSFTPSPAPQMQMPDQQMQTPVQVPTPVPAPMSVPTPMDCGGAVPGSMPPAGSMGQAMPPCGAAAPAAGRGGRISYGSATGYVDVSMMSSQRPGADNAVRSAPTAVGGNVMRITINGDNGAPEYFVDIRESELPVTIGRTRTDVKGKTIVVNEPTVSSQHVRIGVENGVITVTDCCSTCGTVIGGEGELPLVLRDEKQKAFTPLYADSFSMMLGRMNVRVELTEAFCAGLRIGCRIMLNVSHKGGPAQQAAFFRTFSIGRSDADLTLSDPRVSRMHAVVRRTPDGRFVLCDQNSTNGVFDAANGGRVEQMQLMKGSAFIVGDTLVSVADIDCGLTGEQIPASMPKTVYFDSVAAMQSHNGF